MNGLDARGVLAEALKRGRWNAKKSGASNLAFRCPKHDDQHASAWLGDHAWGCSTCGFSEGFASLAEVLGVTLPSEQQRGLTVAQYAERKGLALDRLAAAGVRDEVGKFGDSLIAIPYRAGDGTTLRTKYRTAKGTFWGKDGTGAPLYGLDVLAAMPAAEVLLVEGESDCHSGWQRGLCVIGLPGASQWRGEYGPLLAGRTIIVWQEPDEGGATMVAAVAKSLPKALVLREVRYRGESVKDLNDLHRAVAAHGEDWRTAWAQVRAQATPIGAEGPVVAFDSISGDTLVQLLDEKLAPIDAVPTPLAGWNMLCGGGGGGIGLARGWLVTIGANTGTGKSLIALNLAAEAIRHGETVCFVSLEMGRSELATRLLSIVSGQPVERLEQGPRFDSTAYTLAAGAMDDIRARTGGHVLVNRKPISRLADIVACMRFHHEMHGCRYFICDYLQLAMTQPTHSIHERIEMVSHQLREVSAGLGVTLVTLSQFNRATSANRAERPVAQSLMGGSAIENDSHQVLLFDHSRFVRNGGTADTWLLMDKNRHGSAADIPVRWEFRTLRLVPRTPTTEEEEAIHGRLTRYGRMNG